MKTINEVANEVSDAWIAEVTPQPDRAYTVPHPVLAARIVRRGILAGLQMAAEVCEVAAVKEANKADAADRRNHEDQVLKHESRQEVLVKARDAILALKGGE
jgi:hypothetical protein